MPTHTIEYSSGKFKLSDKKREKIETFVNKVGSASASYVVSGFSDSSADHEYNLALSKARLGEVEAHLKMLGVSSDKIIHRSFGERYFTGNASEGQLSRTVTIEAEIVL